jgi:hypothetical protein
VQATIRTVPNDIVNDGPVAGGALPERAVADTKAGGLQQILTPW